MLCSCLQIDPCPSSVTPENNLELHGTAVRALVSALLHNAANWAVPLKKIIKKIKIKKI